MSSREHRLRFDVAQPLSALTPGTTGVVIRIRSDNSPLASRLISLGITPGARVSVLQTFPGVVFLCDETELVVERTVASHIDIDVDDAGS